MSSPRSTMWSIGMMVAALAITPPLTLGAQATATKCKDGTTSAVSGRGACSGHGGVDVAATKSEKKTVKAMEKTSKSVVKKTPGTQVTQTCADGTTSNTTGRGACSGHGGVKAAGVTAKATGAPVSVAGMAPLKTKAAEPKPIRSTTPHTTVGSGGAEDKNPAGAIAQCKDGMYSHAKGRTGACSRHGGVARWM